MTHAIITILLQIAFGLAYGDWLTGGLVGIGIFVGREVAQAEYRWIEGNGGLRAAMPQFKGFDVRLWNQHSITDVLYPVAGAVAVYFAGPHVLAWLKTQGV